ncbi:unnamed protein product [Ambrosiozyma monospora]|uniref:Unnamed protein product n=1 Tax=Ambrosiozyma monospora TaxID=43982 RepID=A0A9W7DCV3_AMBMO|nr:unnamed protein product [Ambrosiozyma monospora]
MPTSFDSVNVLSNFTSNYHPRHWPSLVDSLTKQTTYSLFDNKFVHFLNQEYVSYILTILLAATLVSLGSFATIEQPENALDPNPNHPLFDQTDKDRRISLSDSESNAITTKTALSLPFLAGLLLVGLYFGVQKLDSDKISRGLNLINLPLLFSSVTYTTRYLINLVIRKACYRRGISSLKINPRYRFTISTDTEIHPNGLEEGFDMPDDNKLLRILKEEKLNELRTEIKKEDQKLNYYYNNTDIIAIFAGAGITAAFHFFNGSENWILNNILGSCTVIYGMSTLRTPNFTPAVVLLVLFFVYDIYFVFGSEVMIKVATTIKMPAKLLIPRKVSSHHQTINCALLGLGDIVLPGSFISLCLRFDLFKFHEKKPKTSFYHLQSYPKVYFTSAIVGYIIGLAMTIGVMHFYHHGQPALLYLSPSLLMSVFSVGIYRGEIPDLFSYYENSDSSLSTYTINKKSGKGKGILEAVYDSDVEDDDEDYIYNSDNDDDDDDEVEKEDLDEGVDILGQDFDSESDDDEIYVNDGNDESDDDDDSDDDDNDELETFLQQDED